MAYHNITIAGGGALGSQIAFQTAYCGYNIKVWLRNEESIERTKARIEQLKSDYIKDIESMSNGTKWCNGIAEKGNFDPSACSSKVSVINNNISYETDLAKAIENADLIIESLPEVLDVKKEFFKKLFPLIGEKTIIATNSSTIVPSALSKGFKKPENFLGFHFSHTIRTDNIAEIMPSNKVSTINMAELMEFATNIKMVSTCVSKEKSGYIVNSLLVPFLLCALDLYANGVGTPDAIDSAWKLATRAPQGPFELFDELGLPIALDIIEQYQKVPGIISPLLKKMLLPYNYKGMKKVLSDFVSQGKTGVTSGEGFYKYNTKYVTVDSQEQSSSNLTENNL